MPEVVVPATDGGQLNLGKTKGWMLVVVYRGKHCPLCRTYLKKLSDLFEEFWNNDVAVFVVSADTKEKAETQHEQEGWRFPVGYDLSVEQMRQLGLYISQPRSAQETDRPFPEPGLFVINPEGALQIVDISNAPFARPDLEGVLNGLRFIRQKQYPVCPNLQRRAWRAGTLDADLDAAARAYVNHPRGVTVLSDHSIRVSSLYKWFSGDFGSDEVGLVAHLRKYADPALSAALAKRPEIAGDAYDWSLNDLLPRASGR